MRYQPSLQTERLRLRPFVADDADTVAVLAGNREIATATSNIPHPYSLTAAKTWIAGLPHYFRSGAAVHFAACTIEEKHLVGCFALNNIDRVQLHAELECWIGVPWQNQGFATEAANAVIDFGFTQLGLHRIYSYHLADEPKSSGLMKNLGLQHEGVLRQAMRKQEEYRDLALAAILATDLLDEPQAEG